MNKNTWRMKFSNSCSTIVHSYPGTSMSTTLSHPRLRTTCHVSSTDRVFPFLHSNKPNGAVKSHFRTLIESRDIFNISRISGWVGRAPCYQDEWDGHPVIRMSGTGTLLSGWVGRAPCYRCHSKFFNLFPDFGVPSLFSTVYFTLDEIHHWEDYAEIQQDA